MKIGDIMADGSVYGQTFSGPNYKGEHPRPRRGKETYGEFYDRVEAAAKDGFHKGDLSWDDYRSWCRGYPGNEECKQHEII